MCEQTCGCQNPVELKGRPEDCTPEQIRKCHTVDNLIQPVRGEHTLPYLLDMAILAAFCIGLFAVSLFNIRRRWIA